MVEMLHWHSCSSTPSNGFDANYRMVAMHILLCTVFLVPHGLPPRMSSMKLHWSLPRNFVVWKSLVMSESCFLETIFNIIQVGTMPMLFTNSKVLNDKQRSQPMSVPLGGLLFKIVLDPLSLGADSVEGPFCKSPHKAVGGPTVCGVVCCADRDRPILTV